MIPLKPIHELTLNQNDQGLEEGNDVEFDSWNLENRFAHWYFQTNKFYNIIWFGLKKLLVDSLRWGFGVLGS